MTVGSSEAVLPFDAVWKYNQDNIDLGAGWAAPSFDDSNWDSGPGLLGEEISPLPFPIRTALLAPASGGPRTVYFRNRFFVPFFDPNQSLQVSHVIDDGAVLYLNGVELTRIRMGPGPIDFDSLPNISVGDAVMEGLVFQAFSSLAAGENILAAELHQAGDNSSDVVFGIQLTLPAVPSIAASPVNPRPKLKIRRSPSGTVLEWTNGTFSLERTSILPPTWEPVPTATSPYVVPAGESHSFYQLVGPPSPCD